MGYIFLLILGAVVVVGLIVAFMTGRRQPVGKAMRGVDVTMKTPASDEPTPGASATASQSSASAAQKKIPPA
jgi:hypothetical protein